MPGIDPAQGHIAAIVLALAGRLSLEEHDLEAARDQLAKAYVFAVGTKDMPVVALVAVGLAGVALAENRPADAAEILGAAAALRGAEDATQRIVAVLTARATRLFWVQPISPLVRRGPRARSCGCVRPRRTRDVG